MGDLKSKALELHAFHDQLFASKLDEGGEIYGEVETWLPIKESGHYRRMHILDQIRIEDIQNKIVMDFGSGPWGFCCVFPKLRNCAAGYCVDVSECALTISKEKEPEISGRLSYLVSDGDLIPVADDCVDVFWGGEVMEHVRSPIRFMQEIARVCKENSMVVLSTPNRDAIYYKARGEDNTIGPEHIALLNYDEFNSVCSRFLHIFDIFGYEISLYPDLDEKLSGESILDRIQQRAYYSPQTASGMISIGRVSKALYAKNNRAWRRLERTWEDIPNSLQPIMEAKPLFGPVTGGGLLPGERLHLEITGEDIILLFWAHDWSGICRITVDDETHDLDLYSPLGGFRRFEVDGLFDGVHHISIQRLGRKRGVSKSDEVIFYKVITYI